MSSVSSRVSGGGKQFNAMVQKKGSSKPEVASSNGSKSATGNVYAQTSYGNGSLNAQKKGQTAAAGVGAYKDFRMGMTGNAVPQRHVSVGPNSVYYGNGGRTSFVKPQPKYVRDSRLILRPDPALGGGSLIREDIASSPIVEEDRIFQLQYGEKIKVNLPAVGPIRAEEKAAFKFVEEEKTRVAPFVVEKKVKPAPAVNSKSKPTYSQFVEIGGKMEAVMKKKARAAAINLIKKRTEERKLRAAIDNNSAKSRSSSPSSIDEYFSSNSSIKEDDDVLEDSYDGAINSPGRSVSSSPSLDEKKSAGASRTGSFSVSSEFETEIDSPSAPNTPQRFDPEFLPTTIVRATKAAKAHAAAPVTTNTAGTNIGGGLLIDLSEPVETLISLADEGAMDSLIELAAPATMPSSMADLAGLF